MSQDMGSPPRGNSRMLPNMTLPPPSGLEMSYYTGMEHSGSSNM